jgi:hypothetical protein
MAEDGSDVGRDDDDLEITDLHPRSVREHGGDVWRRRFAARAWQRLAIGLGLLLSVAVLLGGPTLGDALGRLTGTGAAPSPTAVPAALFSPTETVSAATPPAPESPVAPPTALPGGVGVPTLGPAPANCGGEPPTLTQAGPPWDSQAIGREPVLLGGFVGPYATLRLGPDAAANAYGWTAPYTRYGWPAPIGLVLRSDFAGPVTLSGRDLRTGHPLWFGFIEAGVWGAPQRVVPVFTLDLANPSVPAGGATASEAFWYGYAFLPGAGCYMIAATWPGGGWQITVSAAGSPNRVGYRPAGRA